MVDRSLLDQLTGIHHPHLVGDLGDDPEVMTDQQDGRAVVLAEPGDQTQYLSLDGDVQCGGRFVSDEYGWVIGQRCSDNDPLTHAAGEAVRRIGESRSGVGDSYLAHQLDGTFSGLAFTDVAMGQDRLRHL